MGRYSGYASGPTGLRARHVRARARVHLDALADVDEEGHLDRGARLERRGLVPAAGDGVAAQTGVGLGDLELDRGRELEVARVAVDEEHVDGLVRLRPLERVGEGRLRDRHLLVGLGVHEVRVRAVGVEELHLSRLGAHGAELLAGPERAVDDVAVGRAPELRAHERAALARLDVLELEDLEDGAVDLDVVAVLELICAYHGASPWAMHDLAEGLRRMDGSLRVSRRMGPEGPELLSATTCSGQPAGVPARGGVSVPGLRRHALAMRSAGVVVSRRPGFRV